MPVPTTVPALRGLLAEHGLRPKKSLGQNFLIAEGLLQSVARAADILPDELVVEVGPGVGTLTAQLARAARHVVAVEIDRNMVAILRETLSEFTNVTVIHEDILKLDLDRMLEQAPSAVRPSPLAYKVVANLPYYITSAVIRKFLEHPRPPGLLALMVQEEVARRILAGPGEMSLLAVSVQFYAVPTLAMKLPAGAFYPAPNVDSAVVLLTVRNERRGVDPKLFFRVAQAGFGQKRKQLRNSLAAGLGVSPATGESFLQRAGIDPQRRAQTLAIEEWERLANSVTAELNSTWHTDDRVGAT
jgi:16S rRNA (adenine1518-N6/adenine1519-N6)-dimethyltransferase